MKNSIENNFALWNDKHDWAKDGDEWDGQARYCQQPYEAWKKSVVAYLIEPNISHTSTVLEIAPGHGRWSVELVTRCQNLILADLSPSCIDFCKQRLAAYPQVSFFVNDGKTLAGVPNDAVDFIWSFDAFVHMSGEVIEGYFGEIYRVLKCGGKAVIHHAARNHFMLPLAFMRNWGDAGTHTYKLISMGKWNDDDGWRSNVSRQNIVTFAGRQKLVVQDQVQWWGEHHEFGVPRYGDFVTTLRKDCTE